MKFVLGTLPTILVLLFVLALASAESQQAQPSVTNASDHCGTSVAVPSHIPRA